MMKKVDLLKALIGEFGRSFVVFAEWVKENDTEIYEHLLDKAENRVLYDDWLVEYNFTIDKDEEIEIIVTVGADRQMLNNQPAWIHETVGIDEFMGYWNWEAYLKQLEQQG